MTASAACGRPTQQVLLTVTTVAVPRYLQEQEADVGELTDVMGHVALTDPHDLG